MCKVYEHSKGIKEMKYSVVFDLLGGDEEENEKDVYSEVLGELNNDSDEDSTPKVETKQKK